MYAVFESGSHQYRVSEGDRVTVDRHPNLQPGDEIVFEKVLLVAGGDGAPIVGQPLVAGARVVGTLDEQSRGKKIIVQKFRRRKNVRRRRGHRQWQAKVRITRIETGGA